MASLAAVGLLALVGTVGCGNQYRPVVNPVTPTGPAAQPSAYAIVLSQPNMPTTGAIPLGKCSDASSTYSATQGVTTVVDFSGDSIMAQALVGIGPLTFALDASGFSAYVPHADCTLDTVPISNSLQTKNVQSSTLLTDPDPIPINVLPISGGIYVVQKDRKDAIAWMSGTAPPSLKQEIAIDPIPINMTGIPLGQRIYSISQGNSDNGTQPKWGDCDNPSSVTTYGVADSIEVATNTVSNRITVGACPVYGLTSADGKRTFILNRGSGTVTVINSQLNTLDRTISVGAGPVFADLYTTSNLLVTANYDSGTVSIIDVSLDVYGNDSSTFGNVLKTVQVGTHPAAVTILQNGSKAYVANKGTICSDTDTSCTQDGTVSVVNLTSFTVDKTISIGGSPRSIASIYNYPTGKVYVSGQTGSTSPYLTVIRTDTDVVSTTLQMQGNIVDVHVTAQYPGSGTTASQNLQSQSHSMGSGVP